MVCLITKNLKAFIVNIIFLLIAISVVWRYVSANNIIAKQYAFIDHGTKKAYQGSDVLGWVAVKNSIDSSSRYYGNNLIYKTVYSFDEKGLRKTPAIIRTNFTRSIGFFGCSFAFGSGLADSMALPYIIQTSLNNKFKAYNFALPGYGTQHMLYMIDHNIIDSIITISPSVFIYIAIPDHVKRILGHYQYCNNFPRYVLDPQLKEPKLEGYFKVNKESDNKITNFIDQYFIKRIRSADIELFALMVNNSKKLLMKKYPDCEFHVLLWDVVRPDNENATFGKLMEKYLIQYHIKTHLISNIIPDYVKNISNYTIKYPIDCHPNYKINKMLANYIVKEIIDHRAQQ